MDMLVLILLTIVSLWCVLAGILGYGKQRVKYKKYWRMKHRIGRSEDVND